MVTVTTPQINAVLIPAEMLPGPFDHPIPAELETYQRLVGGYLEGLPLAGPNGEKLMMFVDEDGKEKGLRPNLLASFVRYRLGGDIDAELVVGNALVVGVDGEDEASVSAETTQLIWDTYGDLVKR